jgi:hypothetical protein
MNIKLALEKYNRKRLKYVLAPIKTIGAKIEPYSDTAATTSKRNSEERNLCLIRNLIIQSF